MGNPAPEARKRVQAQPANPAGQPTPPCGRGESYGKRCALFGLLLA